MYVMYGFKNSLHNKILDFSLFSLKKKCFCVCYLTEVAKWLVMRTSIDSLKGIKETGKFRKMRRHNTFPYQNVIGVMHGRDLLLPASGRKETQD